MLTVTLYTTPFVRHFMLTNQFALDLQLNDLISSTVILLEF